MFRRHRRDACATGVWVCRHVVEVVQEGEGAFSWVSAIHVARVVFDAGAVADFFDHFQVVFGACHESLGFEEFALVAEFHDAAVHFYADACQDFGEAVFGHDIVDGGEQEVS